MCDFYEWANIILEVSYKIKQGADRDFVDAFAVLNVSKKMLHGSKQWILIIFFAILCQSQHNPGGRGDKSLDF